MDTRSAPGVATFYVRDHRSWAAEILHYTTYRAA